MCNTLPAHNEKMPALFNHVIDVFRLPLKLYTYTHHTIFLTYAATQMFGGIYIYIYAFIRRFYPKRLTLHSRYSFYILSALAFPGNRTHDLGVASAMLYQLNYRKVFSLLSLPRRHLSDQKYIKNRNIVKYYYNQKSSLFVQLNVF